MTSEIDLTMTSSLCLIVVRLHRRRRARPLRHQGGQTQGRHQERAGEYPFAKLMVEGLYMTRLGRQILFFSKLTSC